MEANVYTKKSTIFFSGSNVYKLKFGSRETWDREWRLEKNTRGIFRDSVEGKIELPARGLAERDTGDERNCVQMAETPRWDVLHKRRGYDALSSINKAQTEWIQRGERDLNNKIQMEFESQPISLKSEGNISWSVVRRHTKNETYFI